MSIDRKVQKKALPVSEEPTPAQARNVQLERELAGLSHRDQVQRLQPPRPFGSQPVQQKSAGGEPSPAQVKNTAADGVSGSGQSLPFLDKIRSAMPGHDLSNVQAHVGGRAADSCSNIGASAYATGNDVAFKKAPDLHTAAHEAAHVVQQRAGVQLSDGVGKAGDAYERQADQVADAVVQGKNAENHLSTQFGRGGDASEAVQKNEELDGGHPLFPNVNDILTIPGVSFARQVVDLGDGTVDCCFSVQPNIDMLFNDILSREYRVRCPYDIASLGYSVYAALTGDFLSVGRTEGGTGDAHGSLGVANLIAQANLVDTDAVGELVRLVNELGVELPPTASEAFPLDEETLVTMYSYLAMFADLRTAIQAVTGPVLQQAMDSAIYLTSGDGADSIVWTTREELQVDIDEAVASLRAEVPPACRATIHLAEDRKVEIDEERTTWADFIAGYDFDPGEDFERAFEGVQMVDGELGDAAHRDDVTLEELGELVGRSELVVTIANGCVRIVEEYEDYRNARHALGSAIISLGSMALTMLVGPFLGRGLGTLGSMIMAGGTNAGARIVTTYMTEGDLASLNPAMVLTESLLAGFTAGAANIGGQLVAERLTPYLARSVMDGGFSRAIEYFGGVDEFMSFVTREVSGLSGEVLSTAIETTGRALTDPNATWGDLLEGVAVNLWTGWLTQRFGNGADAFWDGVDFDAAPGLTFS